MVTGINLKQPTVFKMARMFTVALIGVVRGAMTPQSILNKNMNLGNYNKYLPLRDCFLAELFIGLIGLTKEKYNTALLFVLARVMTAQPQWPANGQASLPLFKTNFR